MNRLDEVISEIVRNRKDSYLVVYATKEDRETILSSIPNVEEIHPTDWSEMASAKEALNRFETGELRVIIVDGKRNYGFNVYPREWVDPKVLFTFDPTPKEESQGRARIWRAKSWD